MLPGFDHWYLRRISRVFCDHRVSNVWVRNRVLDKSGKLTGEVVDLHQLR